MDVAQTPQPLETPIKPSTQPTYVAGRVLGEECQPSDAGSCPTHCPKQGLTFKNQDSLPKLPVPDLESTCQKYLESLSALQSPRERAESRMAVEEFLKIDGPALQEKLRNYASSKTSYIEQFCGFFLPDYVLGLR